MATITTYLLVSGPEQPDTVAEHDLFSRYAFDHRSTTDADEQRLATVTFALQQPLEEADDLTSAVRDFSTHVPGATVVLCEVEERFDQVERLQLHVYRDGKEGGAVEHGYVFNVGPE